MGKILLAVCEMDDEYRGRFVTYLIERRINQFEVHAFSKVSHFREALSAQSFDVVLLGRGFEDAEAIVRKLGIPQLKLCELAVEGDAEDSLCRQVFRYQPMGVLIHEIQAFAGMRDSGKQTSQRHYGRLEVIGVYSPIQHEMQMAFSVVLADRLAESRKVLYINLIENSGFLEMFDLPAGYDMGDIILRLRNKQFLAETFLKCLYELDKVHYIQPFHNLENLKDFSVQDYLELLKYLEESTDFEAVIFDFGEGMGQFSQKLQACQSIYCPVKAGYYYQCRTHEFLTYMQNCCPNIAEEQFHVMNLPFSAKQIRGGDVRKQLLWSEFGDYVRAYLDGGSV